MVASPLAPLIDWLHENGIFGWLSIGATLLEGSSETQRLLAAYPVKLTRNPDPDGKPRSLAVPWGLTRQDGWLLVWMTRPEAMDGERIVQRAHLYMVAKKHQLGFGRGASFVYDESTGQLIGASYDSGQTEVKPETLADLVASLRPLDDMDSPTPVMERVLGIRPGTKRKKNRR